MKPPLCVIVAVLLHVIFTFPKYSDAIKCWVCRSDTDPPCADPFDNSSVPINDCSVAKLDHLPGLKATMCRKMRQKVNGKWRWYRSCAFLGSPGEGTGDENYCLMRTGTYNVFVETCTCNSKDGCNGSTKNAAISLRFMFFLAVTVLLVANLAKCS